MSESLVIDPEPLTASEALLEVKSTEKSRTDFEEIFQRNFTKTSISAQTEYAHLIGIEGHYQHKKNWSYFIIMIMTFMVIFQMVLIVNVGTNAWDYKNYEWLLPTLMIQYFGQIIGLAWLIVKSLFTKIN